MKRLQLNLICKKEFTEIDEYTSENSFLIFLRNYMYEYTKIEKRKLIIRFEFKTILIDYSKIFDSNNCALNIVIEIDENYPGEYYFNGDDTVKSLILIIQSFFKSSYKIWFYIETLEDVEIELIDDNRELNPISIINLLNDFEQISKPNLEVLYEDEPSEQEQNYYFSNKNDFKNINDFWLSSRIAYGGLFAFSIVGGEYQYFKDKIKHSYDSLLLGQCIPQKSKYIDSCKFLQSLDSDLNESKLINCYEMLGYSSVVFDFEDKYVLLDVIM